MHAIDVINAHNVSTIMSDLLLSHVSKSGGSHCPYVLSPQHVMVARLMPRAHVKNLPADMEEYAPGCGVDCPFKESE